MQKKYRKEVSHALHEKKKIPTIKKERERSPFGRPENRESNKKKEN